MGAEFYIFVFLIVFIINLVAVRVKRFKMPFIILGFIILLALIGFRYNVGTDYQSYLNYYSSTKNMPIERIFTQRTEPFVVFMSHVFSNLIENKFFVFFIYGFLTLLPLYLANKLYGYRYLPYSVLLFCVLYLPFCLNGMRQGVSISFILLAFTYLANDKWRKSIVGLIIAFLFHYSSLVVIPFFIVYYLCKKFKKKTIIPIAITTAAISSIVLFFLGDILLGYGFESYNYLLSDISTDNINISYLYTYLPIILIPFIPNMLKEKWVEEERDKVAFYKQIMYSGFVFFIVGTAATYLNRFSLYFTSISILLLPMVLKNIKNKKLRILLGVLLILYLILFFVQQYVIWGRQDIIPYQTWIVGE